MLFACIHGVHLSCGQFVLLTTVSHMKQIYVFCSAATPDVASYIYTHSALLMPLVAP